MPCLERMWRAGKTVTGRRYGCAASSAAAAPSSAAAAPSSYGQHPHAGRRYGFFCNR